MATKVGKIQDKSGNDFLPITDASLVSGLANVATSGSYDDLSDKPTIPAPEIFWATYGTTTAAEIDAAVQAGKAVMCRRTINTTENFYRLTVDDTSYYWFVYGQTSTISWAYLRKADNLWVSGNVNAEQTTNRRTSWQATPDDNHYPSEKLVKDSLDAIDNVFVAVYGTTTAAAIDAAIAAGKAVIVINETGVVYSLSKIETSRYVFNTAPYMNYAYQCSINRSTSAWSTSSITLEKIGNKVSSWQGTPDNDHYPSEKLVKDSIDAVDNVFFVTYGSTLIADIEAANSAGKVVFMLHDNKEFRLSRLSGGAAAFTCSIGNIVYRINVNSNNVWSSQNYTLEQTANLVTSFGATPSDSKYPSEKLVKDSIDAVDKVFWATYGTTTASEIDAAVAAGKTVMLSRTSGNNTVIYRYIGRIYGSSAYDFLSFTASYSNLVYYCRVRSDNNNWDSAVWQNVGTSMVKSSWSATPSNGYVPSEKLTYDAIHPAIATTQPAGGFLPNILYNLGTLSSNTTFALATPADANVVNHYYWTFETGSTAPTITWPTGLTWMGGSAPTINASKHYEISVLNGIGVAMEV